MKTPDMLFAYGTLMPGDPERPPREGWSADAVRGRLFDLGPYPALVDLDDPSAGWVEGFVRPTDHAELEGPLDRYEEVEAGLYRRALTISRNQRQVWVYEYVRPLPSSARVRFRAGMAPCGRRGHDLLSLVKETSDAEHQNPGRREQNYRYRPPAMGRLYRGRSRAAA